MDNMQNSHKGTRESIRKVAPYFFALCWFAGSVLIAFFVLTGVTSYADQRVDLFTAFEWIVDLADIKERQLFTYIAKGALGLLYFIYLFRILKKVWYCVGWLRVLWKKEEPTSRRNEAMSNLQLYFGEICGLAVMHLLWARLLNSSYSLSEGGNIVAVSITVFLLSGILSHYVQKKKISIWYVLVDTLRNILAVLIIVALVLALDRSVIENMYRGVIDIVEYIDHFKASGLKEELYVLYDQVVYAVLHMIVLFNVASLIKWLVGFMNYHTQVSVQNILKCRFEKNLKYAAALIALCFLSNVLCLGTEMSSAFLGAIDEFLPIVLASAGGLCILRFTYPEKEVSKIKAKREPEIPKQLFEQEDAFDEWDDE